MDLCDLPDIVVVAFATLGGPAHIHVPGGETGMLHYTVPDIVDFSVAPALGDIDGDGLPEIVSANSSGNLMAFEHDGTLKWQSPGIWSGSYIGAIALADMDNDGDVEIVAGNQVFDHLGNLLWTAPQIAGPNSATTAADLDGDGALEMVLGHAAVYNDGSLMWNSGLPPGYPQVAHMDGDGLPEVVLTNADGLALIEHDGTVTYQGLRPTGAPAAGLTWTRPATIHNIDGDGQPSPPVQVIRDVEDRWIRTNAHSARFRVSPKTARVRPTPPRRPPIDRVTIDVRGPVLLIPPRQRPAQSDRVSSTPAPRRLSACIPP